MKKYLNILVVICEFFICIFMFILARHSYLTNLQSDAIQFGVLAVLVLDLGARDTKEFFGARNIVSIKLNSEKFLILANKLSDILED